MIYNGHSVLGQTTAFEDLSYPDFYQIIHIASCLSYSYYVTPVLERKGAEQVDILSNLQEGKYVQNRRTSEVMLEKIFEGFFDQQARNSWQDILVEINMVVKDSVMGLSGAKDNSYIPPAAEMLEFTSEDVHLVIPDAELVCDEWEFCEDEPSQVISTLTIAEDPALEIATIALNLKITYAHPTDLFITLVHGDVQEKIWAWRAGRQRGRIELDGEALSAFKHLQAGGAWHLVIEDSYNDRAWHGERRAAYLETWSLSVEPRDAGKADLLGAAYAPAPQTGGCAVAGGSSFNGLSMILLICLGLVIRRRWR